MAVSNPATRSSEELARLGNEILRSKVEPLLGPQGKGKYVAIAVDSGEFETDDNSQRALTRLLIRYPQAEVWLARAGYKAAFRMGLR